MTRPLALTLPHGALAHGCIERRAEIRIPTGEDELHVLDAGRGRVGKVGALLERCLVRLGDEPATPDTSGSLVAGDRDALLLHLRAAAFGNRLDCVLECPACHERMGLELPIDNLLLAPYPDPQGAYEMELDGGRRVRFRLPTGADLEEAAATNGGATGGAVLLRRCLIDMGMSGPLPPEAEERLEGSLERSIERSMAELDPQAEITIVVGCRECGREVRSILDPAGLILDELAPGHDELYAEVHSLACHYHWSERDILGLEVPRRRRYLDLIADSYGAAV